MTIARAYNIRYNGNYGRARNNDRYNRNRGRIRNTGRNNRNLTSTIRNLKYKAARFEDRVDNYDDRYNDRDRWGRRSRTGNLESLSDRFKNAVDRLEDEYDGYRDYNDSYDEVRRVLSLGEQVDREMSRSRTNSALRRDWNSIESDLRTLANAYNIRYNGRSGFGIGDIIRGLPF